MCGGIPQKCGSGINKRCWHECSKRGSFKLLSLVEPPCMLNWWAPCFDFFSGPFWFDRKVFKWKHHNIQFKYAAIQIKDYQTIDCMPLLTLIFNQFTAHVQEHRVRKYENISDSYCWLILCECDVFINLMTPRSKVDLGNLRNLQDSQNLRPLRSRLLAVNDATTRGSLRWRDLIPIW